MPALRSARLRGRLLAADTSQPVRLADVRVVSTPAGVSLRTTTDRDGVFDVPGLPAGVYTLAATKAGFVSLQYGQRRPFEPGTPVELSAGETKELEFALPRGSVIAGRIMDDAGDPVPFAVVSAARYVYAYGGRRRLESADVEDTTDDRGQFRIFGLMPGEYLVSASEPPPARERGRSAVTTGEGFARTYYPGVAGPADAAVVTVGLGQEATANFGLVAARLSTVSGTVTDSLGQPLSGASVLLGQADGSEEAVVSAQSRQDGSFVLQGVSPGNLVLTVRRDTGGVTAAAEMARVSVGVPPGSDVTGLSVSTGRGATIDGTVLFRASSATDRRGLSVSVRQLDAQGVASVGGSTSAPVDANGRFRIDGVFGAFALELSGPRAANWTLESATVDGHEATDHATAPSGRSVTARVVVSDRLTDAAGSVVDTRGIPRSEFVVVFLPVTPAGGSPPARYVRTVRPSGPGQFRLQGMPVGTYLVAALESLEEGREWDPAFHAWAQEHGTVIRLEGGQQTAVHLQF